VTESPRFDLNAPGSAATDQGAVPAPDGSEEISLVDLLIVIASRKRLIAKVTAASLAAGVLVSFLLPVRYSATVIILPPQQNSSMGAMLASQLGNLGGMAALAGGSLGLKSPNDMYVGMLKSRTVEDAMVQKYRLKDEYGKRYLSDARKTLEKRAVIDGSGKDGLIRVTIEDRDKERAAELANGYVEQFRSLSENLAITEASQRRLFFEKELQQAKNNLAGAEEALKLTQQSTGVIQLDSQARALIESAASLRAQITAREVQIQGMQTYATGENPQLVQAQRELEGLRAQLAKLGGSEDSGSGELLVPKGRVPEAGLEFVRKLRDVKYNETIFDILARQFELAKLDEAKQGAVIQVVDPAVVPDRRSSPKRTLIVIGATALGFFLAVFIALFQACLTQLNHNPRASEKLAMLKRSFSLKRQSAS
jgi:uncharacterized protein involved in exopolysaccharide biosynthesis